MKTFPVYLARVTFTEDTSIVTNPATGEILARMSNVDRPVVAQAIQDAHEAFALWRHVPGRGRGELLHAIGRELHRRRDEVARLITLEMGSP